MIHFLNSQCKSHLEVIWKYFPKRKGFRLLAFPKQLNAELRPYQEEGYDWLVFHAR